MMLNKHSSSLKTKLCVRLNLLTSLSIYWPCSVFNMCYPKGCNNFYAFLKVALLKLSVQVSSSVVNFITCLDSL